MNFYQNDPVLKKILETHLDSRMFNWADKQLVSFGERCGTVIDERAKHTDREGQPKLVKYNQFGEDISHIWVNEGYKQTVRETYQTGIVGYVYKEIPELNTKGNYMYSYAQGYLLSQSEPGFYCPVTLSMATALLLDKYANDQVKDRFLPHVLSTGETELYEGATFLTERQGGSDVGANEVAAVKNGDHYLISGEKYFASNAGMCGVAMVLARVDGSPSGTKGLSLFAVPWRLEDGQLNGISIRRLKDKLGVRAVPSAEVEFTNAKAYLVGEESKGIYYMMEALNLSRICNAVASIGIMRRAYQEALDYAFNREAFKKKLIDYPMVQESLLALCVKHEVETVAIFDLIKEYDLLMNEGQKDQEQAAYVRLLIAILKKETAEQAIHFSHEAIELLGGNGYIEDFVTPRLLRDAQVLTVWEGTANILGLELLRLMQKTHVHKHFCKRIKAFLENDLKQFEQEKEILSKELHALNRMTTYIERADEETQTYYAKKIAVKMVGIFEAKTAIQWAIDGSERERVLLKRYMQQTFHHDCSFEDAASLKKDFDKVVLQ
ncbi:acyl-CoA dehydrogenase family protein [Alkalihalophilus marmarensis]|uniref:Isovaleryl-CoA dehydrogenase n=1 Tax=Alkalihalophilus marmarensis DSM 21297 TaxID=1188261 RepID=U6SRM6_9BACI|nr:acyl-CoA dehydrogenase family protein [Alkalihalophilus marmarensis]ERN54283.1 isovaleryl-CoA dehydrogenase [Alkalihalophilus marmarensis DSM 21297]MCM3488299.1 acyl-CoA dehydrogenase family protein [Alkalihalophilus marmarensis]